MQKTLLAVSIFFYSFSLSLAQGNEGRQGSLPVDIARSEITPAQQNMAAASVMGQVSVFRENKGQMHPDIRYSCLSGNKFTLLMKARVAFGVMEDMTKFDPSAAMEKMKSNPDMKIDQAFIKPTFRYISWSMFFEGCNPETWLTGEGQSESYTNYLYSADNDKNVSYVHDYDKVLYHNIYNGIDLHYYSSHGKLKYDFIVKPGASPATIHLKYEGIERLEIDGIGRLHIFTPKGEQIEDVPYSYQEVNGKQIPVRVKYKLLSDKAYGFEVTGAYNNRLPLVIDPMHLYWSTYFGATGGMNNYIFVNSATVDSLGFVYITGATYNWTWTWSQGRFPVTPGAYDTVADNYYDVFVTKFNQSGSGLIFSTLIGGGGFDFGTDITTNKLGAVFITGFTNPWLSNPFPKTVDYTTTGSEYDVYASQISPQGDKLIYSVQTGGALCEMATAISINSKNEVFVTGTSQSTDLFTTPLAYRKTLAGSVDMFLFRVNAAGTLITYSTYFGGNPNINWCFYSFEVPMEIETYGNFVYIFGTTTATDLPTTTNAYKATNSGQEDMFLFKFNVNALPAAQLLYCSYLGSTGRDIGYTMQLLKEDLLLFGGCTSSNNFPNKVNNYYGGTYDGIAIKMDITQAGTAQLISSRYVGGSNADAIRCIRMNKFGTVYTAGGTMSNNFCVTPNGYDTSFNGNLDAFLVRLTTNLDTLVHGSYFGGSGNDFGYWNGIEYYQYFWYGKPYLGLSTADCVDKLALALPTNSPDFPITDGAFMTTYNSSWFGAAVVMFRDTLGVVAKVNLGPDTVFCKGFSYTLDAGNADSGFHFRWNISETDTFQHFTATTAGTYYVDVFNVCSFRRDSVVIKHRDPEIKFNDIDLVCGDFAMTATAGNIVPGTTYTYKWSTGQTTRQVNINKGGVYWAIATNICGSDTDTLVINQRYGPGKKLGNDTTLCDGAVYTLSSGETDARYKWNDNPLDSLMTKQISSPGKYWVQVTNPCGTASDTIVVDSLNTPILASYKDTSVCNSVFLTYSAFNAKNKKVKYQWDQAVKDTLSTFIVNTLGQHTVQIKNFCATLRDTFYVTKDSSPAFSLGPDQVFCDQVTTLLDATYPGAQSYSWSNGMVDPGIYPSTPGLYFVEVTNKCGKGRDSIVLSVVNLPVINLGQDTIYCDNISRTLYAGSDGDHYQWNTSLADTFQTINVNKKGIFWVDVTNLCGTNRDSIFIDVTTKPVANLGNDTVYCNAFSRYFNASYPYSHYSWNTNPVVTTPDLTITTPGLYEVTVTNPCGTAVSDINIKQKFTPVVNLGNDTSYCGKMSHKLDAFYPEARYEWNTGLAKDTMPVYTATKSGLYSVTVSHYCGTVTDNIRLDIRPFPKLNLGKDSSICDGVSMTLDAGDDGSTYIWQPSGNNSRYEYIDNYGTYVATVINQYGCEKTDTFRVLTLCPPRVFVPNAFTPNGADTKTNEVFIPSYMYVDAAELTIYSRWGEKIFYSNDLTRGWDGKIEGVDAPEGMYYWKLTYRGYKTETNLSGSVVLVR